MSSKFEVGQKWKTADGCVATVVYSNERGVAIEYLDKSLDTVSHNAVPSFLLTQVVAPKYRPFAGGEFAPKHSVVSKEIESMRSGWFSDTHVWIGGYYSWEDAFKKFTFEDGTPFGIEVKS